MKKKCLFTLAAILALPAVALAQVEVAPAFGSFAAAPGVIVFVNNANEGDLVVLNTETGERAIYEDILPAGAGATDLITGSQWLFGTVSAVDEGAGDLYVFDLNTAVAGSPIANLNDVRDFAVIDQGGTYDALVVDRANDTVHLISDVLGSSGVTEITPDSIAGNIGIQGLAVLSESLYFLYDELPDDGFGSDELVVVEGGDSSAATTRISWNQIGSAGAGLGTDELSVDFHNGLAVRQPDDSTIVMYLSNFGAFSESQIIEVVWTDEGSGFDFSSPTSRVLITEPQLFDAIGSLSALGNARGVAVMPGATPADDQLVIWVDDSEGGNTYMVLYDIADESFSVFGDDALEFLLVDAEVKDWQTR